VALEKLVFLLLALALKFEGQIWRRRCPRGNTIIFGDEQKFDKVVKMKGWCLSSDGSMLFGHEMEIPLLSHFYF
jgi:hypothetical protein